jgi:uncharacterized membrane protein
LQRLQEHRLIQIEDTAIVSWPLGAAQPTLRQISDLTTDGTGVLNGAFWGMLFGLVFSLPLADATVGPAVGILTGYLAHYGFNEDFFKQLRHQIVKGTSALLLVADGTSALFLLTCGAESYQRPEAVMCTPFEILSIHLSHEQDTLLHETFGR